MDSFQHLTMTFGWWGGESQPWNEQVWNEHEWSARQKKELTFMITMRKVQSSHIHARLQKDLQLRYFPARRSNGTNDFGTTTSLIGGMFDGVQRDIPTR